MATARQFCALVERAEKMSQKDLMLRLYRLLPDLIGAAIQLPEVELEKDDDSGYAKRMPTAEWRRFYELLGQKFGEVDRYFCVFDPRKPEKVEPIFGLLSDDVADIYRDLTNGFAELEKFNSQNDAAWGWRLLFYSHWGQHAINALYAIHAYAGDDYFEGP
jgi:hypothetical protein